MRVFLWALGRSIVEIFTHHKLFIMFIFVLSAGNEIPLPADLSIILNLIAMFALIFWWLGQRE